MHPLNSVKGAITTGVVLAVVIGILLTAWSGLATGIHPIRIDRWLHIISGVTWIGLLYYFNLVQTPGLAAAAADKGGPGGAGISKYIAPRALLWFRWGAVATWVTGVLYLFSGTVSTAISASKEPSRCRRDFAPSASGHGSAPSCCSMSGFSSGRTKRKSSGLCRQRMMKKRRRARSRAGRRASISFCRYPC